MHCAFCCAFTVSTVFCSGSHEVVLGLHDFDDFDNGGQPEVYDIDQIVVVCIHLCYCFKSDIFTFLVS